ncbi:hemicentin-1-like isoform X1 [Xenia sp. Carnegie-2017]|uniref:hemicentin-1-like isoform X1 n=1 Tax=Xenia sp. Carnegie-2017 TaxID=2897299 RepID=UPI001F04F3FB|nr:hemicentin-1-like isoform X1 [Xenia sp. Carnegie-2017]
MLHKQLENRVFLDSTTMKGFSAFLILLRTVFVSCTFDLYGSMDDARDAIISFYDPVHKEGEKKVAKLNFNKFAIAMKDIERALANAQLNGLVRHNEKRLGKLLKLIKTAVSRRSYRFARKAIGEAMYTIKKLQEKRRRGKRSPKMSSKSFLANLKKKIGEYAFSKLLVIKGHVTLMFAIDNTGSMSKIINAAKNMATAIVTANRTVPVDYILSPFDDPGTGPVSYYDETQEDKFLKAISSLKPRDGGDCLELTFAGMRNAIDHNPQDGSPLYVFTDAGAKDASNQNIMHLSAIAQDCECVVVFFYVENSGCSTRSDITPFHKVAKETNGHVFVLNNRKELEKLADFTSTLLGGTTDMASYGNKKRKKRSSSKQSNTYTITVDDSVDTMVILITTDQAYGNGSSWNVSLTSPTGSLAGVTTNSLNQGRIHQISNPIVGIWNLGIQSTTDVNYDVSVKGVSTDNIDFEVYFVRTTSRRVGKFTISISSPILGVQNEAILNVRGISHVNKSSLAAELVTLYGDVITSTRPTSLSAKDSKGIRHLFKFHPPNQIFKIQLKGLTKKGNSFERISKTPVKAETLIVKVLYARNDFTLKHESTTYLIFSIENFGNNEVVDFKSFGNLGTVERQSRKFGLVRKGRKTSFVVTFRGKPKATPGMTMTVVVSVTGRSSGSVAKMSVPLLVVE